MTYGVELDLLATQPNDRIREAMKRLLACAFVAGLMLFMTAAPSQAAAPPVSDATLPRIASQTCLKLFWTTPPRCAVRPHHYILGARVSLSKVRWQHWGKRRAIGIGRFYVGASWGDPDGGIGPAKARVVLSKPVNCFNRYRTFGRMTVKYGKKFGKKAYRGSIYEPCVLW